MDWKTRLAAWFGVIAAVSLALWFAVRYVQSLPPERSPFAALDLERPIGWATALQFDRVRGDPQLCTETLAVSQVGFEAIEDRREGAGNRCGFSNAVALTQSTYPYSGAVRVSCPLAAALYVWEREVVAPAAARWLESPVARIEMIGAYSCRNVYGRAEGRLSEHARANAIDVAGFRLENGRLVTLLHGWEARNRDAAFLRQIRNGGCEVFQAVLSPDYNRAHADHLHLDMGRFDICR
jgi:hypothetical protein